MAADGTNEGNVLLSLVHSASMPRVPFPPLPDTEAGSWCGKGALGTRVFWA